MTTPATDRARSPLYSALVGLASLGVLLQGVWAGLFIREGKDFDATSAQSNFVEVHDWGARIAIVLALAARTLGGGVGVLGRVLGRG